MLRKTTILALLCSFLLATGSRAEPFDPRLPPPPSAIVATETDQLAARAAREFGTLSPNIMQIPAAAFHPEYSTASFEYKGVMYYGPATGSVNRFLWAPLMLPSGARVHFLDLYYNDTNVSEDVSANLRKLSGEDNGTVPITPTYVALITATSVGSPGYGYAIGTPSGVTTINNDARYDPDGGKYIIEIYFGSDTGLSFSGVDVWWTRQISPAPAVASFTDVSTGHWAFQHIEALKASGITTGCTASTYCPNNNVTRAEMAVFLARALGLHWGDE